MTTTVIQTDAAMIVSVLGTPTTVPLSSAQFTLDKSAVPYASGTVVLPAHYTNYTDPLSLINPPIFKIGPGLTRQFDMFLRSRTIDYAAKTQTLTLVGGEALLQDYAPLVDDTEQPYLYRGSIRDLVNYVISYLTFALEPGGPDVPMDPYWDAVNYILNPTIQAAGNWYAVNSTIAYNTAGGGAGGSAGYGQANNSTATNFGAWAQAGPDGNTAPMSVREGDQLIASLQVRSPSASVNGTLRIAWFGQDNNPVGFTSSATIALTSSFMYIWVYGTAPRGAVKAGMFFAASTTGTGKDIHWDLAELSDGPFDPGFFSGATTDTAEYEYSYSGANNASQSTRLALVDSVDPEAFIWKAGQSAWDFLTPFTTQAGMVLWCDERGKWWLDYPANRYSATSINLLGSNSSAGTDVIDLDSGRTSPTGVIVRYTWTTRGGIVKTRVDSAGTGLRVAIVDYAKPWPGAGAAAAILARRTNDGRAQNVTAVADYTVNPGMTAVVNIPGAASSTVTIEAVTFNADVGFMDITTVGRTG